MTYNPPKFTYDDIRKMVPCAPGFREATAKLGGKDKWSSSPASFADMAAVKIAPNDIIWVAANHVGDADYERRLRLFAADCAARVLPLFEAEHPDDQRPRRAIEAARAYARGEIDDAAWEAAWEAARAAARAAAGEAARAAAWAAAWEAAWDAPGEAARAAAWAAAWDTEKEQQLQLLLARFSEVEPEDCQLDRESSQ